MTAHTPIYNIPVPDSNTLAYQLGNELYAMGLGVESALQAASIPAVTAQPIMVAASAAARDAFFGVPATEADRLTLQRRGAAVVRTDLGRSEMYYATYNASTNPVGAPIAGWWPIPANAVAKVLRSTAQAIGASTSMISFESAPIALAGAWSAAAPTRLVLPFPGSWKLSAGLTSNGLDSKLLRSFLVLNGATIADSTDNKMGTAGVTDPFTRPATTVRVTNTTSYIELGMSSNGTGTTAVGAPFILAEYLGANVG